MGKSKIGLEAGPFNWPCTGPPAGLCCLLGGLLRSEPSYELGLSDPGVLGLARFYPGLSFYKCISNYN